MLFQELLQKTQDDILTVRSIIKTNENLREVLLSEKTPEKQKSQDYIKLLNLLKEDIPKTKEWRIYDHCAAVTKLYAIYENFVEDLIRDWLRLLPDFFSSYDALEERIRSTHQLGVGRLLLDFNKSCQSVVIQSIQIEGESVNEVNVTTEIEIGLKFDLNAKSGLDLYIVS